ncbi:hypothetical protein ACF3M2_12230 [Tissierella carlieri]|uniref:hypothetical protein n=1 Tax=Tissierella carlieri TaxID=689904 RepID=UPI00386619E7
MSENLFALFADCRTQKADSSGGVKVEDGEEILMLKVAFGIQSAPLHKGVGDADGGGIFKGNAEVVLVIVL